LVSAPLHLVEHGKTVRIGKSKIEDDGGIAHRLQGDFGGSRIGRRVDIETGSRQRLRQKTDELVVVLDHQYPHLLGLVFCNAKR
jgi:hypothetical protein